MPVKDVRDKIRERNARLRLERDGYDVPIEGGSGVRPMLIVDDPHAPPVPTPIEQELYQALDQLAGTFELKEKYSKGSVGQPGSTLGPKQAATNFALQVLRRHASYMGLPEQAPQPPDNKA